MKLIGLLVMSFAACATAGEKYEMTFFPYYVRDMRTKWFGIDENQLVVRNEITDADSLTVKYSVSDITERRDLGSGSGSLCGDHEPKLDAIIEITAKTLGLDLKCPISKQTGNVKQEIFKADIHLDENPGEHEIFVTIELLEPDQIYGGTNLALQVMVWGKSSVDGDM